MADTDQLAKGVVKIPLFSGKKKEFMLWWMQMQAYAQVHKFRATLSKTIEADMPVSEVAAAATFFYDFLTLV